MVRYTGEPVKLTQAARKHKVGKARIVAVMTSPYAIVQGEDGRLLFLGDDHTGRALEIIGIRQNDQWIVLHAMDLRKKFRAVYEEGKFDE